MGIMASQIIDNLTVFIKVVQANIKDNKALLLALCEGNHW